MRNILEYPIRKEEVVKVLADLCDAEIATDRIGGIEGCILSMLLDLIQKRFDDQDVKRFFEINPHRG